MFKPRFIKAISRWEDMVTHADALMRDPVYFVLSLHSTQIQMCRMQLSQPISDAVIKGQGKSQQGQLKKLSS